MMFESYYSFFHHCRLSCRYVMLQKSILSKPKWGRGTQAVAGGYGAPDPTVVRVLAISTNNNTPVANFVNSR